MVLILVLFLDLLFDTSFIGTSSNAGCAMAEWVRVLAWPWLGLGVGQATGLSRPGSNPTAENFAPTSLRNFGNSVYPVLPKSVGPFYLVSMALPGEVKYPKDNSKK